MSDEAVGVISLMILSCIVGMAIPFVFLKSEEGACEKENNVYACERVYQPKESEK